MEFEKTILYNLCCNSEYTQKVNVHLKSSFFDSFYNREIYFFVDEYISKFKGVPTKSVLQHKISKSSKYNETQFKEILEELDDVFTHDEKQNLDWLVDETEKHCQTISAENGIIKCFEMIKKNVDNRSEIISIMRDSLNVEFESNCGIEFFDEDSIEKRFEEYNSPQSEYVTGLETFDAVCPLRSKTITVLMAPSGVGKTMGMISLAAGLIKNGYSVGYITLEMSELETTRRIEANLINVPINEIKDLDKSAFKSNLMKLKESSYGTLFVKEYPTASASCTDFEKCIDDWKLKDGFVPDVLFLDYLNIAKSIRVSDSNSYQTVKSIVEEFRGMMVRLSMCGVSATQTNRNGMIATKLNSGDVSDSVGTVYTADVLIGITSTEDMRNEGYQTWSPVSKNRSTGILDYYFPMISETEYSRVTDGTHLSVNNQIFLNNNPDTIERVKKLKRLKTNRDNRNFDSDVKLIKKKENNFKFEEEEEFDFMSE